MWTKSKLQSLVKERLEGSKFIAVSNREPYMHSNQNGEIVCMQPASGLTTALNPIMSASGGVWIAHGSGSADRQTVDARDHVAVPPDRPEYTLRRVWVPRQWEQDYYYGLSNQGLWPLCHVAFQRPRFSSREWESYRKVNELFANAVLEEAEGEAAFVFIQDYHFALLPRMLKQRNPRLVVAQFWHIPWPSRETFRAFPWHEELLDGMLGNDLLGFHLRYHCSNFLNTVDRGIEALVDTDHFSVNRNGGITMVRPFPISIDSDAHRAAAASPEVDECLSQWRRRLSPVEHIGVGIDRIDYTKGILERLRAIDLFLGNHPEYRRNFVFVQIGVPSRIQIPEYADLIKRIECLVEEINDKWGDWDWDPILFEKRHAGPSELMALHRLSNFCIVSSLHDGMNLVAKEFVSSRADEDGVLILSRFTGAARELTSSLLVNPFSEDEIADAIHCALTMHPDERRRRMVRLRSTVAENNIYRWAGKILTTLSKVEVSEPVRTMEEEFAESLMSANVA